MTVKQKLGNLSWKGFYCPDLLGAVLAWLVSVFMARIVLPTINLAFHPLEVAHLFCVAVPVASS